MTGVDLIVAILPSLLAFLGIALLPGFLIYSVFIYCWALIFSVSLFVAKKCSSENGGYALVVFTIFYGFLVIIFVKPIGNFLEFFYLLPIVILHRFFIKETIKGFRFTNQRQRTTGNYIIIITDIIVLALIGFLLFTNYGYINCIGNYLNNTTIVSINNTTIRSLNGTINC